MTYFVHSPYRTHVRELGALLNETIIAAKYPPLRLMEAIASSHLARGAPSDTPPSPNDAPLLGDEEEPSRAKGGRGEPNIARAQPFDVLDKHRWHPRHPADALGLSRQAIVRLMQKRGVQK